MSKPHPTETVRIITNYGKSRYYHTDDDCPHINRDDQDFHRDTRLIPLDVIGEHYTECGFCADDGEDPTYNGTGEDWTTMTCPECGAEMDKLPRHLRKCDGGESE